MRRHVLPALILGVILANLIVFGGLSTNAVNRPVRTPRPSRVTFTPNPELLRRRVTATPSRTPTVTRTPTSILNLPRRPHDELP